MAILFGYDGWDGAIDTFTRIRPIREFPAALRDLLFERVPNPAPPGITQSGRLRRCAVRAFRRSAARTHTRSVPQPDESATAIWLSGVRGDAGRARFFESKRGRIARRGVATTRQASGATVAISRLRFWVSSLTVPSAWRSFWRIRTRLKSSRRLVFSFSAQCHPARGARYQATGSAIVPQPSPRSGRWGR
jgi:hypothetical protein